MPHRAGGPVPTASRSGRELQRYGADGERLVAGSIPVRFTPGVEGPEGVQVLLISSRKGKGHVFPKGGWEEDEGVSEAAMRETVEEAGVRGELEEPLLGEFPFFSGKADRLATAHQGRCLAFFFAMHVTEVLDVWPEAGQRDREWCSLEDACCRCRYDWMREALMTWMQRRGWHEAAAACRQRCCSQAASPALGSSQPATPPAALLTAGQSAEAVPAVVVPAVDHIAVPG